MVSYNGVGTLLVCGVHETRYLEGLQAAESRDVGVRGSGRDGSEVLP